MQYGMIGYYVPHKLYPDGYHCNPKQPLPFACLASQKNYMSIYMMTVYGDDETWFRTQWAKSGKKLDMGKCCVRFKKLENLALDVIAAAIRRVSLPQYIAIYEAAIKPSRPTQQPRATAAKKPASSKQPLAARRTAKTTGRKKAVRRAKG
jgi:hypothetical protein